MRLVFRADATSKIGSGHVMRSSVLAEHAISEGYKCIFIGKVEDLPWVSNRMENLGFIEIHKDFETFRSNIDEDVLVLDSYSIPANLDDIQLEKWRLVVTISDSLTPQYSAHLVIIPGLTEEFEIRKGKKVLSGTKYILIRKSINKKNDLNIQSEKLKIIVNGGGTNVHSFAETIAEKLDSLNIDLEAYFFTDFEIQSKTGKRFISYKIGPDLDSIAANSDIAITTASTSALEFLAREIPIGVVCAVENQKEFYKQLGEFGYAIQLGNFIKSEGWHLNLGNLQDLVQNVATQKKIRNKIANLIDFDGASRILTEIVNEFDK